MTSAIPLLLQSLDVYKLDRIQKGREAYTFACVKFTGRKAIFPQALHDGLMAEKIGRKSREQGRTGSAIYNQLALTYYDVKNDSMAILYFQKSSGCGRSQPGYGIGPCS
jgi:hypothetical protein